MKNIAWIFKKFKEELSGKELKELSNEVDKFIFKQSVEFANIEAQIQLVQAVKIRIENRLINDRQCSKGTGASH